MNKVRLLIISLAAFMPLLLAKAGEPPRKEFSAEAEKQIKFKKVQITLNDIPLTAEIADTQPKQERGLMNRKHLSDKEAMLFVFDRPEYQSFWMKNTLIPLSIGFFDDKKNLFQIEEMDVVSELEMEPPLYRSKEPAKYALEVPKGWFSRKKIKVGQAVLHLPKNMK